MMKDIGLWGPKMRRAYEQMGIIGFCTTDVQSQCAQDEAVAMRCEAELHARMGEIRTMAATG